jgi:hypothetical protein
MLTLHLVEARAVQLRLYSLECQYTCCDQALTESCTLLAQFVNLRLLVTNELLLLL